MSFLPKGYEVPSASGNYMKLKSGENKFRFLSEPVIGFLRWVEIDGKRKPERIHMGAEFDSGLPTADGASPKHFWSMIVYDYADNRIKILELTQTKVIRAIADLIENPKWGDAREYDVVINGTGELLQRSYTVMPEPKEALDKEILKKYEDSKINLEALFSGEDPFAPKSGTATPKKDDADEIFGA